MLLHNDTSTNWARTPGSWVTQYIGLPYLPHGRERDGVDCWGLVRLILQEQRGYELPLLTEHYTDPDNHDEVTRTIMEGLVGWTHVDRPQSFDIVILRLMGHPWHCGLYLGGGMMIHTMRGHMSALEQLASMKWKNRIEGYYRWEQ